MRAVRTVPRRTLRTSLLLLAAVPCTSLLGACGAGDPLAREVNEPGTGEIAQATICDPSMVIYPIRGPHNTGYDKKAGDPAQYTCDDANSGTDYLFGDHYGIDMFAALGTPVVAVQGGTLKYADFSSYSGNRVAIIDACGWHHFYCHLNELGPGLVKGQQVKAGQLIGTVGKTGTESNGSVHLHYSLFPDGNYNQGIDPWPLLHSVEKATCGPVAGPGTPVTGVLDEASCGVTQGWAQDPDKKDDPAPVHLYFGGPAGSGVGKAITAGNARGDLCGALGSCNHGFSTGSPYSLFDGQPHAVHAYGIDLTGGDPQELVGSPKTLQCPPTLPGGVKRWIIDPASLAAWRFDPYFDQIPAAKPDVDKIADGPSLGATPVLVQVEGDPKVYVQDGLFKHHIPDENVLAAWRFSFSEVQKVSVAYLDALALAAPLRARPVIVLDSTGRLLLLDDALPVPPTGPGPGPMPMPDPDPNAGGAAGATAAAGSAGAAGATAGAGQGGTGTGGASAGTTGANGGNAGAAAGGNGGAAGAASKAGSGGGAGKAGGPAKGGAGGTAGSAAGASGSRSGARVTPAPESDSSCSTTAGKPGLTHAPSFSLLLALAALGHRRFGRARAAKS